MSWTPENSLLSTVDEIKNIFHSISYEYVDEETQQQALANVTVVGAQQDPLTVTAGGNTISGYYSDIFTNKSIQYLNKNNAYDTVELFKDVDVKNLKEVVSFKADVREQQIFTYTATAKGLTGDTLSSKDYTVVVTNNWTPGQNALRELVRLTKISQDTLVRWSSGVIFVNKSGQPTNWETKI
jgi:hypothetical protein